MSVSESIKPTCCLLLVLFLAPVCASATFISPGKYRFDFVPNLDKELTFLVGDAANINVTLGGQLTEYARIVDISDTPPDQKLRGKIVRIRLTLPEFIPNPGLNELDVRAMEVPLPGQGTFGTAVTVIAPVYIRVPYPGVYVVTDLNVNNVNENETVNPVVFATNYGYENITAAWAEFDLFDSVNRSVTTLKTESSSLLSGTIRKTFSVKWDSRGYRPGDYYLAARFFYRNNVSRMRGTFKIGNLVVHILNYTRTVKFQTINPFDVIVQSGWNAEIANVYAIVTINQSSFQTPSLTLAPWETKTLKGYFDSTGFSPKTYPAEIRLYYEGLTNSATGEVEILGLPKKSLLEQPTLVYGGIILVLILLLVLSILLFGLSRRKKGKAQ
jgi:hypothetical protein